MARYPFLISIPHGGTHVPGEVADQLALTPADLAHYSDPGTRALFRFGRGVVASLDTGISRMVVDLNRPPYHLPPRHPDGVVKQVTVDGKPVYRSGIQPDIRIVHRLLMAHYFPYHAEIDRLLDPSRIRLALDCHSMLPHGPPTHPDRGRSRPLICLGNNGDERGEARPGRLCTCPSSWMLGLAGTFREEFGGECEISLNRPFSGGFITNAHYWHKGIPWIQIEVNRDLYEGAPDQVRDELPSARARIWRVIRLFWDQLGETGECEPIIH